MSMVEPTTKDGQPAVFIVACGVKTRDRARELAEQLLYYADDHTYLGETVTVTRELGGGWIETKWPDGRTWKQWKEQVI